MHDHRCRYCGDKYVCEEAADECFQHSIVCQECFWTVEFRRVLLVLFLLAVAVAATVFLYREMEKPAFGAPASLSNTKNLTGEIYQQNGRKTISE